MAKLTIAFGALLGIIGAGYFVGTGSTHPTALIPVWFGCGLLAFLLFVMELAYRANLCTPPHFNNAAFVPALLAFVILDTVLLMRLILHFSTVAGPKP